jgi:hypothetical protein
VLPQAQHIDSTESTNVLDPMHVPGRGAPKKKVKSVSNKKKSTVKCTLHRNGHCHWISRPSYSARSSGRAPLLPRLYRTAAAANEREERRGRNETKELGFFDLYSNPSVSQPSVLI